MRGTFLHMGGSVAFFFFLFFSSGVATSRRGQRDAKQSGTNQRNVCSPNIYQLRTRSAYRFAVGVNGSPSFKPPLVVSDTSPTVSTRGIGTAATDTHLGLICHDLDANPPV